MSLQFLHAAVLGMPLDLSRRRALVFLQVDGCDIIFGHDKLGLSGTHDTFPDRESEHTVRGAATCLPFSSTPPLRKVTTYQA